MYENPAKTPGELVSFLREQQQRYEKAKMAGDQAETGWGFIAIIGQSIGEAPYSHTPLNPELIPDTAEQHSYSELPAERIASLLQKRGL